MPTLNDVAAPKYADIFNYINPNTVGGNGADGYALIEWESP